MAGTAAAAEEQKFSLAWRSAEPVLDYKLWGYWTEQDALAWQSAITKAATTRSRAGAWYMLGDLSEMRAQRQEVNLIRDEVTDMALRNGLGACLMYGMKDVSLLQLRRLLANSGREERFGYFETREDAEQELRTRMHGVLSS